MPNKDLHDFIRHLERDVPDSVLRIKKEVDCEYEIPAILQHLENQKKSPVVIFENVRAVNGEISKLPVVINLFGSRERLADALDTDVPELPFEYIRREKPVAPVMIDNKDARVKDIVTTGDEIDLYRMPVLTHHEMDLGPYITGGSAWVTDPETGLTNCAIIRILFRPAAIGGQLQCGPAYQFHFPEIQEDGQAVPMVVVIGHHSRLLSGGADQVIRG